MARRKSVYTVQTEGRDKGKSFLITEMPADQAERWATRALIALANAGTKLPDGVLDAGMAGVASMAGVFVLSLRTLQGLSYDAVGDLLDELMGCVQFQPMAGAPPQVLFPGENSQIEEVRTRLQLKWEVLQVHTDFSLADALSSFRPPSAAPAAPAS
jgi:hypothetical protein